MRVSSNRRARGGRANSGGNRAGAGNNRRSGGSNRTYDSNGPDGKIRGTATQVYDKYVALGTDAQNSGDRIAAENYFQHAEHYFRIVAANTTPSRDRPTADNSENTSYDDNDNEDVQISRTGRSNDRSQDNDADSDDGDDTSSVDLSKVEQPDVDLSMTPELNEPNTADTEDETASKAKRKVSRTRTLRRRTSSRNTPDKEAEDATTGE
ncbi:MAG: hypothetical protein CMN55_04855 [Sneathiella sp.]|jgi:hypothetical protein|uniref:DUF4167 domain-containing protein n=1 Tax=Sneathiella sp. TaxID=1964365 RepID=UPI000C65D6CC|nr:DUF4167 domain-containing protein [Sneathiella sp.]MAL78428.1 hypothetical protein [Sneathiella sp.]